MVISSYGFEGWIWVLNASVPGLCMLFTFTDDKVKVGFTGQCSVSFLYIFIAFALDESVILDVLKFPMKNIYQSFDLGLAICGETSARANNVVSYMLIDEL